MAAVLTTVAAAPLATDTVIVIGGYAAPAARTSLRVQRVPVHVQPGPEAAIGPAPTPGLLTRADSPAGSVSVTVTALPSVASEPRLLTVSVSVPVYSVVFGGLARSMRECDADSVRSGAACAGAATSSASAAPSATDIFILYPFSRKRRL